MKLYHLYTPQYSWLVPIEETDKGVKFLRGHADGIDLILRDENIFLDKDITNDVTDMRFFIKKLFTHNIIERTM